MKTCLTILCICFSLSPLYAQIDKRHQQAILDIAGKDFKILPNKKSYPYTSINLQCKIQPSITKKHDTTGVYFNNEYLLFRHPIRYKTGHEVLKLMNPDYVSVEEYLEFQDYVRDSMAREKIYQCLKDDDEASKFILHKDQYFDAWEKQMVPFQPSDRQQYRNTHGLNIPIFPLNWKHSFSYADVKIKPCVVDMYLPQPERIYKIRAFDERKLCYRYIDQYEQFDTMSAKEVGKIFKYLGQRGEFKAKVDHSVATLSDTYHWSAATKFDRDEFSILGQLYNYLLPEEPVIGITGMQANAFCNWKQKQLQQEVNRKGLKYQVIVTTPTLEDLPGGPELKMDFPERDYTSQWKITVGEYQEFIAQTKDSILRETLYQTIPGDSQAMILLTYPKLFFDEGAAELASFPTFYQHWGRMSVHNFIFPLNYDYKIKPESFGGMAEKIMKSSVYENPSFTYLYFDAHERSIVGKMKTRTKYDYYQSEGFTDTTELHVSEIGADGENIGKDYNMDDWNPLRQSYGVRSYENLRRLIHEKSVPILPAADVQAEDPKSLIKSINYNQAIAFYYWKYPLHKFKTTDDWQKFVLPSEEQFKKVQNGEQAIIPAQKVSYPTPVFRYVVHVFPMSE